MECEEEEEEDDDEEEEEEDEVYFLHTQFLAELFLQTHFYQICIYLYVLSIQVEDEDEDQLLLQASIQQFEEAALEQKGASLRDTDGRGHRSKPLRNKNSFVLTLA